MRGLPEMTQPDECAQTWPMKTCIAAIALATALPSSAAETAAPAAPFIACSDITDAAARLECFDRGAAAAREPRAPATPVNPPAQPATPPVADKAADASAGAQFGDEQLKKNDQPKDAEAPALQAHITATRKASGGLYLIILDNGQTWRHESGSMDPYLKVGEAVTIRKGIMGSYRLTLDSGQAKNWVRVSRVR